MSQRNIAFDIARALCVIWIVAFWHYRDFVDNETFNNLVKITLHGEYLTSGVLSCFMFMSGFFLKKYKFNSFQDIKRFAYKRFWRFYILLFFAACLMLLPKLQILKFITLLTGLSVFLHDQPATLWFFGDLIFFYCLTPFLLWNNCSKWKSIAKSLSIWFIFLILYITFDINLRVLMYFPFYVAGLLINNSTISHLDSWKGYISSSIAVLICFELPQDIYPLYQIAVTLAIICIGYILEKSPSIVIKFFSYISYGSMCVYLYHKFLMGFVATRLHLTGGGMTYLFIIALFILGYYIQKYYDLFLVKINKK